MPGNAKTSQVLLSTATVMVGPVADLHKLNPVEHSIGLVKNVNLTSEPSFTELTQGIQNDIVMSIKTGDNVRMSMEVYEFTLRNLAYAAGLDGSGVAFDPITATATVSAAPATTTVTLTAQPTPAIAAGDFIYIQEGTEDIVHIAKVASVTTNTLTLAAGYSIPATMVFTTNARVGRVKKIQIGGSSVQTEVGAKIVGLLPKNSEPVTILIPKAKITRGFGLSFTSDNFANMPFELTPYAGVSTDPFYSEYGASKLVMFPR